MRKCYENVKKMHFSCFYSVKFNLNFLDVKLNYLHLPVCLRKNCNPFTWFHCNCTIIMSCNNNIFLYYVIFCFLLINCSAVMRPTSLRLHLYTIKSNVTVTIRHILLNTACLWNIYLIIIFCFTYLPNYIFIHLFIHSSFYLFIYLFIYLITICLFS